MLSLHALLFFMLGTSVFAHPIPDPSPDPSVGKTLKTLLETEGFGGKTTWTRTIPIMSNGNDVITFDPPKLPRIGTLLGEPGKFSEGKDITGDLSNILKQIKGSWTLRPDSTNANHRFYEMEVNPDKEKRPIEIYGPQLDTEDWHLIEEYDYPLTNHPTPLPKRITGWWYRISPRDHKRGDVVHMLDKNEVIDVFTEENENDVIHIPAGGIIEWFKLNPEGGISPVKAQERNRLPGTWVRMRQADQASHELYDELKIIPMGHEELRLSTYGLIDKGASRRR